MHPDKILKKREYSLRTVIIARANSGDETRKTVNKTMKDYFPPY